MKFPSRRRVITLAVAAVPAWMAFAPIPAQAAGCQEKLLAVNTRLGEAGELGPTRAGLEMMRDQAANMCSQGQDAMAMQILGMLEMSLPPTSAEAAAAQSADADSKEYGRIAVARARLPLPALNKARPRSSPCRHGLTAQYRQVSS